MILRCKKIFLVLFAFALLITNLYTDGIKIKANSNKDVITINAKKNVGEDTDTFNYYPQEKWMAGKAADEYFTTVDTRLSENSDVYYTIDFEGTDIEVWGFKAPRHAIVEFTIDGINPITIDAYAPQRQFVKLVEYSNLDNKSHQLKCKATTTANANATFGDIQVTEAKIYKPKAVASKVTFKQKSAELFVGDTYQIEYDTEPVGAVLPLDFEFLSEDTSVLTVDNDGTITAHKSGTSRVSGTCQSLGIYESILITVKEKEKLHTTIVDSNNQYQQKAYSALLQENKLSDSLWSWKNDKAISEIAILSGDQDLSNIQINVGKFENEKGQALNSDAISATFITEAKGFIGNAGWYSINPDGIMPTGPRDYYFDIIDSAEPLKQLQKNRVQLVWLEFKADKNAKPGIYNGTISVTADELSEAKTLEYRFEILDLNFNDPENYTFKPDYWTYPFSTAEYYEVEPFSNEHMQILKDHLLQYKNYGGTTLTATLVEEAWGGQTYGKIDAASGDSIRCPSLIKWLKKADGSWQFDYTYFDKFMELAQSIGLGDDIVLYSPIPWNNQVIYIDEATGEMKKDSVSISDKQRYAQYWKPFLQDFASHLDEKGWFDFISLGFDERPLMKNVFDVIDEVKNADGKVFKKKGAYNNIYNGDGVPERMEDLSFNLNLLRKDIPAFKEFVEKRKENGLRTTFYTGTDIFPNTFLRSLPAEGYWTMMFSGSLGLDGFLDWAYDAWVENPLEDTTHYSFQAGDCFMVYPSPKDAEHKISKASIRSEKYGEGIRDINKLYLMQEAYPELASDINQLFAGVKANYDFELVENEPGWAFAGGKPARWITESGKREMLADVSEFKKQIYDISKKYEALSAPKEIPVESIEFKESEIVLEKGQKKELTVIIKPQDATNKDLIWENQDDSIATVEKGIITAKNSGKTIVKVMNENKTVSAEIVVYVKADFTALNQVIKTANGIDASKYTKDSMNILHKAVSEAMKTAGNVKATQKEVNDAAAAVQRAIDGLQKNSIHSVNKDILTAEIAKAEALKEADYTVPSWKVFVSVLDTAKAVNTDANATQEAVDKAVENLQKAVKALKVKPVDPNKADKDKNDTYDDVIKNTGTKPINNGLLSILLVGGMMYLFTKKRKES